MADKSFQFWGGNWKAFNFRRSGEMLLSGPAGTGKTFVNLTHLLWFGTTFPAARMLICRKTRASLTESALVTWENDVLGAGHPVIGKPIDRANRREYKFPNKSVLVTGGMDRPDKILSTEYDLIYVPEATDLNIVDWETLGGRLRGMHGPYDLLFGDCNPTTPTHFLYKRHLAGQLTLIPTVHKDNPRYWNDAAKEWTPEGKRYVLERLKYMTGARKKRFTTGKWEAAEGLVYDGFVPHPWDDPAEPGHLLPVGWEPPKEWKRGWSIDWGMVDPTVILFWAIDPQKRMHLYREIYVSQQRAELLALRCAALVASGAEPLPDWVVGDHAKDSIDAWRAHGKGAMPNGQKFALPFREADKRDRDGGFQVVQGLFVPQADGKPRIFFRPDARRDPECHVLAAAGRPLSLLEELTGYTWDTRNPDRPKDQPIDHNDHAMDSMRYGVTHVHAPRPLFYAG